MSVNSVAQLTGPSLTEDYAPSPYTFSSGWILGNRFPRFTMYHIPAMLTDPRITFGLWLIKGPIISKSRFYVECERSEGSRHTIREFIKKNLTRFLRVGLSKTLEAVEYGWYCGEVIYEVQDGLLTFRGIKPLSPMDCRAVTLKGSLVGAYVKNVPGKAQVYLGGMKKVWVVHDQNKHPYYGRSRLFGAFLPWIEMWTDGGFRDSRRLYHHKYAFDGGILYHPPGSTKIYEDGSGNAIYQSNKELARDCLEKKKTGGTMTLPNTTDASGRRMWEYVPPNVTAPASNVGEYGKDLKDEEWEGMGIPPEVARAEGSGAYAGRAVPQDAFYSTLQELQKDQLTAFDEQVLRPLVLFNFGKVNYDIIPLPLVPPEGPEEAGAPPPPPSLEEEVPEGGEEGVQLAGTVSKRDVSGHLHGAKGGKSPGRFVSKADAGEDRWEAAHYIKVKGKHELRLKSGKPVPKHYHEDVEKKPGPSARNIHVNLNPKAKTYVHWTDEKERKQTGRSKEAAGKSDEHKFTRVRHLMKQRESIRQQLHATLKSKNPKEVDAAIIMLLMLHTGLRVGSKKDTRAEHKAYGISTLKASHVKIGVDGPYLRFVPGKSGGKENSFLVDDPVLQKILLQKKWQAVTPQRGIFNVSNSYLDGFGKKLDGGKLNNHDFRRMVANDMAAKMIAERKRPPRDAKKLKKIMKAIAIAVGNKLGDTPAVILKSYIDPSLWIKWKETAGVE